LFIVHCLLLAVVKSSINSLLTDCSYNFLKKLDIKPTGFDRTRWWGRKRYNYLFFSYLVGKKLFFSELYKTWKYVL